MFASTIISQTFFNYFKWDPPIHDAEAQVALFSLLERNKNAYGHGGEFPPLSEGGGTGQWCERMN